MFTNAELKDQAKQQISGNLGILFLIYIIYMLIVLGCNAVPVAGSIASYVLAPPLTFGLIAIYLGLTVGETPDVNRLFDGFKYFGTTIILQLLMSVFILLWSMLLIVPGIIKAYSYSMAFYILVENPQMSATEALDESKRIMKGNKMALFSLQLSFIGWILLVGLTAGIASIYVYPYMSAATANFYNRIKATSASYGAY
ncbi:MAG: DUF975 family protein [Eubacteriales bacterium]